MTASQKFFSFLVLLSSCNSIFSMTRAMSVHKRLIQTIQFDGYQTGESRERQLQLIQTLIKAWHPTSAEMQELVTNLPSGNRDHVAHTMIKYNKPNGAVPFLQELNKSVDMETSVKFRLATKIISNWHAEYTAVLDGYINDLSNYKTVLAECLLDSWHSDHTVRLDAIIAVASNQTKYLIAHQIIEKRILALASRVEKILIELNLDEKETTATACALIKQYNPSLSCTSWKAPPH